METSFYITKKDILLVKVHKKNVHMKYSSIAMGKTLEYYEGYSLKL